jgi:hypothetical protein
MPNLKNNPLALQKTENKKFRESRVMEEAPPEKIKNANRCRPKTGQKRSKPVNGIGSRR